MNVSDVMVREVKTCGPDASLEAAARLMWENNCGSIPVVDDTGSPIGMVTDRDIAMGAVLTHKPLWELTARDIMQDKAVHSCGADADVGAALETMRSNKIRRVPVVDREGHLQGILSIDDLIAKAEEDRADGLSYADIIATLKSVVPRH